VLASTRYCFTSELYCESQLSFYCPLHLQSLPYCNTIARVLCNIRPPPPNPPVYAMHHTILVMAISCKGQGECNRYVEAICILLPLLPLVLLPLSPLVLLLSKALAPIWYRASTWYRVPWSPLRTHFETWKAVSTRGGAPLLPGNE